MRARPRVLTRRPVDSGIAMGFAPRVTWRREPGHYRDRDHRGQPDAAIAVRDAGQGHGRAPDCRGRVYRGDFAGD